MDSSERRERGIGGIGGIGGIRGWGDRGRRLPRGVSVRQREDGVFEVLRHSYHTRRVVTEGRLVCEMCEGMSM